jgi:hypothetical protein
MLALFSLADMPRHADACRCQSSTSCLASLRSLELPMLSYVNWHNHEDARSATASAHPRPSQLCKNCNLQLKSSKNTLYFSLSLCSSSMTSNRSPVKLLAATAAVHASTNAEEKNHLIVWFLRKELETWLFAIGAPRAMSMGDVCNAKPATPASVPENRTAPIGAASRRPHDIAIETNDSARQLRH